MAGIKHSFQSAKADGADATLVRPSDWNAEHSVDAWEDLRCEPTVRGSGNYSPTFEMYYNDSQTGSRGVYLYSFDDALVTAEKEVFFSVQMPHAWNGGAIRPHIHWVPKASRNTSAVRWGFEYTWVDIGGTFGGTTIEYKTTTSSGDVNLVAGKHYLTSFSEITPTASQDGLSSVMLVRIWRNSSHVDDTYASNSAGLLYFDIHYQLDSVGSDQELVK